MYIYISGVNPRSTLATPVETPAKPQLSSTGFTSFDRVFSSDFFLTEIAGKSQLSMVYFTVFSCLLGPMARCTRRSTVWWTSPKLEKATPRPLGLGLIFSESYKLRTPRLIVVRVNPNPNLKGALQLLSNRSK